ncbi:MAG TPA: M23 family metallopeptidase [Thermoanaerobaculia bacterium]|jgi:murein DD-endopeptidase MepM/ murein hydrolase activator NlpD|nr:M23 family metallopeptidase [Thermoanaerobaculia bacterium]
MRTAYAFFSGLVLGAVGVLMTHPAEARRRDVAPAAIIAPPAAASSGGLLVPVLGVAPADLHDNFDGVRSGGRMHGALDIMAPRGTPVIACVDGTIRKLFTSAAGGLTVYEFDAAQEKVYYYAHLDHYADNLREGMAVKAGTVIGYVGTTGNAPPDAPHLHFAIEVLTAEKRWWQATPINPYPLLAAR